MKKLMVSLIVLSILAFAGSALAASVTNTAGDPMTTKDGALEFTFSPKVNGMYIDESIAGNNQFYIIGTFHSGGEYLFGTAQTLTKVYSLKYTDPGTQAFSDMPQTKTNALSEAQWEDAGFSGN